MKQKFCALFLSFCIVTGLFPALASADAAQSDSNARLIRLSSTLGADGNYTHEARIDQAPVREFDYVWRVNPAENHDEVKDAPAEYYTGEKPSEDEAVYVAHDIFYYPQLPANGFSQVFYDDEWEWAYYYPEGPYHDYIFATLPIQGADIPQRMMHSAQEAYQNAVLHITQPGTYRLTGQWRGQIWVDLGDEDDTFSDENAKVTLILDNVDVTCTVAPAIVFRSAYECDNGWKNHETHSAYVDTSAAGANIVIADDSVNTVSGANVYRMLKTAYKSDSASRQGEVQVQKKKRKIDGAVYSFVSMNLSGGEKNTGVLTIHADFEGLDSELHLTVNGGNIHIYSQDDGMNVNEDGVSVVAFNGGEVHILAGLGHEGDGIDSNGYLLVNGGVLVTMASPFVDSGMDAEHGAFVNGGVVVALGSTMDWAESPNERKTGGQATMNLQFSAAQSADEAILLTDTNGKVVFAYDPDKDKVAGNNARWYQGAIVSSPGIVVGGSYYVYVGGDVSGTEHAGIYDVSTVTGFTQAAKQQCYSSTASFARPGPPSDGTTQDGFGTPPPGGPGAPPPGGFGPPPGGPGAPPPGGSGTPSSDGFAPPPGGVFALTNSNGEREFKMTEQTNGFQAVTDYIGSHFDDVSEESPFYNAIMWAVGTGIAQPSGDNIFSPNDSSNRGDTMLYLWRAMGSPRGNGNVFQNPLDGAAASLSPENPFSDVTEGDAYYEAVLWGIQNGITNGVTPTAFQPESLVTRAQSQAFLYRLTGSPEVEGESPFTDVSKESYSYTPILWAVQNGITNGVSETLFNPDGTLTKAQILTFLYRYVVERKLSPNFFQGPPAMPPVGNPETAPPASPPVGNPETVPPAWVDENPENQLPL